MLGVAAGGGYFCFAGERGGRSLPRRITVTTFSVGPKGSTLQLVLNTVYHMDKSPGNVPYSLYESLATGPVFRPYVRMAVPYAVGDSYRGYPAWWERCPKLFRKADDGVTDTATAGGGLEYRPGKIV